MSKTYVIKQKISQIVLIPEHKVVSIIIDGKDSSILLEGGVLIEFESSINRDFFNFRYYDDKSYIYLGESK